MLRTVLALMARRVTYPTWNPSDKAAGITLSNGNLTENNGSVPAYVRGTVAVPAASDKYWEVTCDTSGNFVEIGIALSTFSLTDNAATSTTAWVYRSGGQIWNNNISPGTNAAYVAGDVISVRYDSSTGTLTFYKNGVLQTYGYSGLAGSMFPLAGAITNTARQTTVAFGPTLAYSIPSGASLLTA